jgi:hypothetical protein
VQADTRCLADYWGPNGALEKKTYTTSKVKPNNHFPNSPHGTDTGQHIM